MDYYVELWCHYPYKCREQIFGPYSEDEADEKADELDSAIDLEFFSCVIINDEDIVEDYYECRL